MTNSHDFFQEAKTMIFLIFSDFDDLQISSFGTSKTTTFGGVLNFQKIMFLFKKCVSNPKINYQSRSVFQKTVSPEKIWFVCKSFLLMKHFMLWEKTGKISIHHLRINVCFCICIFSKFAEPFPPHNSIQMGSKKSLKTSKNTEIVFFVFRLLLHCFNLFEFSRF